MTHIRQLSYFVSLCRPNKKEKNPLLVDLEPEPSVQAKTDMWFQKVNTAFLVYRRGKYMNSVVIEFKQTCVFEDYVDG